MSSIDKYINFCKQENKIPVFSLPWWLDAVCGKNNWGVSLVEKGGKIHASMPYLKNRKFFLNVSTMPTLTQSLGPYIKYPINQKYYKRISWEKKVMFELISQIPYAHYFNQRFHFLITNWMPFYWSGYQQTTRYTYHIKNVSMDQLEKNFETDVRRRRRQKAKKNGIKVVESSNVKRLYDLNAKTFKRQGKEVPYSFIFVLELYKASKKHDACRINFAVDENGNEIAAIFIVYDNSTVYYLMGGINPESKHLGGMDLLLYESIKFAVLSGRVFDFEGSMIENIEKYFRSFGAIQVPYFNVSKINSPLLKVAKALKG